MEIRTLISVSTVPFREVWELQRVIRRVANISRGNVSNGQSWSTLPGAPLYGQRPRALRSRRAASALHFIDRGRRRGHTPPGAT